eukprot:CAMPEP_0198136948 /NCGR_PEP_ID=MMETSP1443-20131203/503_1 /TAXON_ID=186043 /ORGANISM="Entomoneis sp., Strain CCMP2396" /LENGTH=210 /DNA_ID=CAMNT_0043798255 /DNA_START=33 /DNA_END=665 /DNA_ORIENTATION=+
MILTTDNNYNSFNSSFEVKDESWPKQQYSQSDLVQQHEVRFDEFRNQYFADETDDCDCDPSAIWYCDDDFKKFSSEFRQIRKADKKVGARKVLSKNLKEIFDLCSVDFMVENADQVVSSEQRHALSEVYRANSEDDFVGTEYITSSNIKKNMCRRREKTQKIVSDIQLEFDKGFWKGDDELQSEIRECYRNYAQANILFSQIIAKAQMHA